MIPLIVKCLFDYLIFISFDYVDLTWYHLSMDLCLLARSFSALSDPVRLRMVSALKTRPATCSKELAEVLGISVALASHHTKILEDAGLIQRRKDGQFSLFSLNTAKLGQIAATLNATCTAGDTEGCEDSDYRVRTESLFPDT